MLSSFLSFCLRFFRSRIQLQLEIIFLRKQLEILARTSTRPRLRPSDRIFFSVMTDVFSSWKETLLVFKPETVIRWHRQSFRLFWKSDQAGRPKIPQAQIISVDFLVVPTITLMLLHVLVFLAHDRRRIIRFNVTAHPSAQWCAQPLRNAFCEEQIPLDLCPVLLLLSTTCSTIVPPDPPIDLSAFLARDPQGDFR